MPVLPMPWPRWLPPRGAVICVSLHLRPANSYSVDPQALGGCNLKENCARTRNFLGLRTAKGDSTVRPRNTSFRGLTVQSLTLTSAVPVRH